MSKKFIPMTQGPAVIADTEAIEKDEQGFTHPNLHRRISEGETPEGEISPRTHSLAVWGVDSYRSTESYLHDESSTTVEIC